MKNEAEWSCSVELASAVSHLPEIYQNDSDANDWSSESLRLALVTLPGILLIDCRKFVVV
jgi:hypothetical protein